MTLFVDATTAQHARGVGTVIDSVTDEMRRAGADVVVVHGPRFGATAATDVRTMNLARSRPGRLLYQRLLLPLHVALLEKQGMPIERVLLLDSYIPSLWRGKKRDYGVLVHDALPLTHPEFWTTPERTLKKAAFAALRRARPTVFTSTEHNAREIKRVLAVDPRIVRFGCGQLSDAEADAASREPLPKREPYFIAIGSFEPRKNLLSLLASFEALAPDLPNFQLRLAGGGQSEYETVLRRRIAASPVSDRIHIDSSPNRSESISLISHASALVMPSVAEGFGLPIIEALALGTPVVASDLPEIRSWAGGSIRYASPMDPLDWIEPLAAAVGDREDTRRAGQVFAGNFRWSMSAASLLAW